MVVNLVGGRITNWNSTNCKRYLGTTETLWPKNNFLSLEPFYIKKKKSWITVFPLWQCHLKAENDDVIQRRYSFSCSLRDKSNINKLLIFWWAAWLWWTVHSVVNFVRKSVSFISQWIKLKIFFFFQCGIQRDFVGNISGRAFFSS